MVIKSFVISNDKREIWENYQFLKDKTFWAFAENYNNYTKYRITSNVKQMIQFLHFVL